MRSYLAFFALLLGASSCSYSVPDIPSSSVVAKPTYEHDIWPLFNDHCFVCHSHPSDRGAPNNWRLDVYNDENGIFGAHTMAGAAINDVKIGKMPPSAAKGGGGIGPNGFQLLLNWQANDFAQ